MVRTLASFICKLMTSTQLILVLVLPMGPHGTTASDCPLPGLSNHRFHTYLPGGGRGMCSAIHPSGHWGQVEYAECIKFHTPTVTPAGFFPTPTLELTLGAKPSSTVSQRSALGSQFSQGWPMTHPSESVPSDKS